MNQAMAQVASTTRTLKEEKFTTHDGVDLFFRYWPAVSANRKGAVVLFHRGHEHSGRMAHLVPELELDDYDFFAWDARGHGMSPGERGYSPSVSCSIRDVQTFVDHISATYNIAVEDMAIVAQSVGAVLVSAWVHDYAPKIRCMVLASPAFKVKLYVPLARTALSIKQKFKGNFFVNSYVKAKFLTHDHERISSFEADPLITRAISSNILLELYTTADRIVEDSAAITVPTQLFISGSDWVVHHKPQHVFYENLGANVKERHVLKGFFHDTFGEKDRSIAIDKMRDFINQRFNQPVNRESLLEADKKGFTRYESDTLATPLSFFSLRGFMWACMRFGLKFTALLSDGVKLGQKTGFDSGSTLDYVYKNTPSGSGPIGRYMDNNYLNSIGWKGIRQRKLNLQELIQKAMQKLSDDNTPIHIMDIAAGHGRYILEAIEESQLKPDSILLRDYSDINVTQGAALIQEKGLDSIATFVEADAFDVSSFRQLETQATLGVVSGLFELFPDNELILNSLEGFSQTLESGSYLLYTCQPWHPQLEMIARALTSHRQAQAWVMRRRTQEEMDQLVESKGFSKIEQRIDEFGIFTVCLARKN
ncbi:Putative lipase in cluster with Phosphatidate cytidylyltransferase [hydrothermal vent metagenome]|uniref:Lipase in cluster with Phosphatidate cytidylyltransferase n=1 Tax=hydrothermal vent metagenome TaxID=652676 RepID=A0A3B0YBR9_9ZZZZ